MEETEEDCKGITERIKFKERRIAAYENSRDYKKCDEVKEGRVHTCISLLTIVYPMLMHKVL